MANTREHVHRRRKEGERGPLLGKGRPGGFGTAPRWDLLGGERGAAGGSVWGSLVRYPGLWGVLCWWCFLCVTVRGSRRHALFYGSVWRAGRDGLWDLASLPVATGGGTSQDAGTGEKGGGGREWNEGDPSHWDATWGGTSGNRRWWALTGWCRIRRARAATGGWGEPPQTQGAGGG